MAVSSAVFYRNRRLLSLIVVALIFILVTFSPQKVRPLLGDFAARIFYYPFSELKSYVVNLQNVAQENRRLKRHLTEVALQLDATSEARRENRRLREFLGFESPEGFKVVPVKIVSLVQNIYPVAAVINKGSDDSIMTDLPVVNRFGLVGKISDVSADFSIVTLLTDPTNAVSGRVAESRQIGIVRYSSRKGMYLDNLPADANIQGGDLIISSGLGGVYPSGLSVAIVDSVRAEKGAIVKDVWLRPTVNFFEIDELYVLISEGQ